MASAPAAFEHPLAEKGEGIKQEVENKFVPIHTHTLSPAQSSFQSISSQLAEGLK